MRVVVLADKSRRKISSLLLVSPGTRLVAFDPNATNRELAEIEPLKELSFPGLPAESTEMRVVVLLDKSRRNKSPALLVSPGTRLVALDSNVTNCPLAEMK